MTVTCSLAGLTDVGRHRKRNEDAVALVERPPLVIVADGMGGHPAGDVASALAVASVRRFLEGGDGLPGPSPDERTSRSSPSPMGRRMLESVEAAEQEIEVSSAKNPEQRGMGTTLTVLGVREDDGRFGIAHVGDSRAYRWADERLEQLTRDHTWVQEQVDRGALLPEEAHGHPWGHILAQALGTRSSRPQLLEGWASPGDVFLLCTDGLTTMLADTGLERVLREALSGGLDAAAQALVDAANDEGGVDNITVGLLKVEEG